MTDYETKMVFLVRRDLGMRRGKEAAQVGHAVLELVVRCEDPDLLRSYIKQGQPKIVLSVEDEDTLLKACTLAQEHGLPTALIVDQGRTELKGVSTTTVLGVGPASVELLNKLFGPEGLIKTKLL